jgi:hypothetical protein
VQLLKTQPEDLPQLIAGGYDCHSKQCSQGPSSGLPYYRRAMIFDCTLTDRKAACNKFAGEPEQKAIQNLPPHLDPGQHTLRQG